MTRNIKMRRVIKRSGTTGSIVAGFVHGLAQIGSFGSTGAIVNYPKAGTAEALRGDWQRVGADMRTGVEKVRGREKAKA